MEHISDGVEPISLESASGNNLTSNMRDVRGRLD